MSRNKKIKISVFLNIYSSCENLFKILLSLIKVLIISRFTNILKTNTNIKKGCVILGNGPSLTESILKEKSKLKNFDLICVNNFANTDLFEQLKPKYYVLAAPIFFQNESQLSDLYISMRVVLFNNIVKKTNWELFIMVPFLAKKNKFFNDMLLKNKNIKPLYFNQTPIEGTNILKKIMFKKGYGMPRPHNVLIPSVMNAIFLGYKLIYIIGADHSWLPEISVNENNEALVNQKHFYDEDVSKPEKMQDYIVRPRKLHEIIHKFYLTFEGYWLIKEYAESKNVSIFNASEISMIDAFERKSISE